MFTHRMKTIISNHKPSTVFRLYFFQCQLYSIFFEMQENVPLPPDKLFCSSPLQKKVCNSILERNSREASLKVKHMHSTTAFMNVSLRRKGLLFTCTLWQTLELYTRLWRHTALVKSSFLSSRILVISGRLV